MDEFVLTNFRTSKDKHHKLKEISVREQKSIGDILNSLVDDFIKIHGEGNPVYTLDQWKDPSFKSTPAFFTSYEAWQQYLIKCKPDEIKEIYEKAWSIKNLIDKRFPI